MNTWGFALQRHVVVLFLLLAPVLVLPLTAYATEENSKEENSEEETAEAEILDSLYGDSATISIATGREQAISEAPAIASVITAEEIRATGAVTLEDALQAVPGLHIVPTAVAYLPIYVFRGLYAESNPQTLTMIDGVPLTTLYFGHRGRIWPQLPVNAIERIEVIRGPGSAVYGADAVAGVINIVTKDYDSASNGFGGRGGSFGTGEAWLFQKYAPGVLKTAFSLEYFHTDGQKEGVDRDLQTTFDELFGTSASNAPGGVNTGQDTVHSRFSLGYKGLDFRLGYIGGFDVQTGAGFASALDPEGGADTRRITASATYTADVTEELNLTALANITDTQEDVESVLFPPGGAVSFGGPPQVFPEGVLGRPKTSERIIRGSLISLYSGIKSHTIRVETGFTYGDLYDVDELKNFDTQFTPLNDLVDVSNDPSEVFLLPRTRELYFASFQDEWNFASDWHLTTGVRYDRFSDFGEAINPRVALVWEAAYDLSVKLLYGRAFRAPSFAELFVINNPVVAGTPNLDPEVIDTFELAFDYRLRNDLQLNLNLFYYNLKDAIRFDVNPVSTFREAQNVQGQSGFGFEAEFVWKPHEVYSVRGNYAFQYSTDKQTDEDSGNAPRNQAYLRGDWRPVPQLSITQQVRWIGTRRRIQGDPRDDLDQYVIADLNVRYRLGESGWSIGGTVRNVLNEGAREPTVSPDLIPNDIPLAGRALYGVASYEFG